jgi:[CysO sulfur-carrier protein]-S-L-cysteine hydrolase
MIAHCKKELPYEACGLLSGKNGVAETIWKMKNVERSPVSFAMDSTQLQQTLKQIQQNKEALTAIYHSHPTGIAYPSSRDIEYAHYPEAAYIIISLANQKPVVKGFRIINRKVIPLMIQLLHD